MSVGFFLYRKYVCTLYSIAHFSAVVDYISLQRTHSRCPKMEAIDFTDILELPLNPAPSIASDNQTQENFHLKNLCSWTIKGCTTSNSVALAHLLGKSSVFSKWYKKVAMSYLRHLRT